MSVRSVPLTDGKVVARRGLNPLWPAGVVCFLFGVPLWVVGAFYTLQGWAIGINLVAGVIHLPIRAPMPAGWWSLLMIPMGLLYSFVEVKLAPRARADIGLWLLLAMIYALIIATDLGTTYLSVIDPNAGALTHRAASVWWIAAIWTTVLTFLPEWFMIGGSRLFGR